MPATTVLVHPRSFRDRGVVHPRSFSGRGSWLPLVPISVPLVAPSSVTVLFASPVVVPVAVPPVAPTATVVLVI